MRRPYLRHLHKRPQGDHAAQHRNRSRRNKRNDPGQEPVSFEPVHYTAEIDHQNPDSNQGRGQARTEGDDEKETEAGLMEGDRAQEDD